MSKREEMCTHGKAEFVGLLFASRATGYCTQGARCLQCGKVGQVPAMFEPECISGFKKHSEYIEVNI